MPIKTLSATHLSPVLLTMQKGLILFTKQDLRYAAVLS